MRQVWQGVHRSGVPNPAFGGLGRLCEDRADVLVQQQARRQGQNVKQGQAEIRQTPRSEAALVRTRLRGNSFDCLAQIHSDDRSGLLLAESFLPPGAIGSRGLHELRICRPPVQGVVPLSKSTFFREGHRRRRGFGGDDARHSG